MLLFILVYPCLPFGLIHLLLENKLESEDSLAPFIPRSHKKSQREKHSVHAMENIVVSWAQLMMQPAQLKIVAATIAVLIFLHRLFKHFFHQHTKLKRVPGPFPWPVVGNLLMLGKLPHHAFYRLSKKYGDIMELKLGSVRTIVISSPEMAKQVLKVHDLICASRPETIAGKILFERDIGWAPYGDRWRHMRKLSTLELLTPKRLEDSRNIRDEEVSWLVHAIFEHCKEGNPVNMQTSLSGTSMNVISRLLFKKRYFNTMHNDEESKEFKDIVMKITTMSGVFNISDYVPFLKPFDLQGIRLECNQILSRVNRFFNKIIQEHLKEKKKANESKDFLDVMLSHPGVDGEDRLDELTIKGVAIVSYSMFL
jgi:cytochrome P450